MKGFFDIRVSSHYEVTLAGWEIARLENTAQDVDTFVQST
jgi:hypothetical protein